MPRGFAFRGVGPLAGLHLLLELACFLDLVSVAHSSYTIRITTGTGSDDEGRLVVYADGAQDADGTFEKGSIVLERSYASNPTITVRSPDTAAPWVGSIEASSDGGTSYVAMTCGNCTSGTDGAAVSVGGDANVAGITSCVDGASCAFYVPAALVIPAAAALSVTEAPPEASAFQALGGMCQRTCWLQSAGEQSCELLIRQRMLQQAGEGSEPRTNTSCEAARDIVSRFRCTICGACDLCEAWQLLQRFETEEEEEGDGPSWRRAPAAGHDFSAGLRRPRTRTKTFMFLVGSLAAFGAGLLVASSLVLLRAACMRPRQAVREPLACEDREEEEATPQFTGA